MFFVTLSNFWSKLIIILIVLSSEGKKMALFGVFEALARVSEKPNVHLCGWLFNTER